MPPAFEVLLLNTAIPQIQAAQSGDTYLVPRDIAINATAIISANSATDALRITQTGAGNAILVEDSANPDSSPFVVTAAGDVGIGTTSPTSGFRLDVVGGDFRVSDVASDDGVEIGWSSGGNQGFVQAYDRNASAFRNLILNAAATIDSSGNLGLGVTPSASVGAKAMNIGSIGYVFGDGATYKYNAGITSNAYVNGNGTFAAIQSRAAGIFEIDDGVFKWKQASTGTANTTLSVTQAMTLDANGDLGVGTTSIPSGGASTRNVSIHNSNSAATYFKLSNGATGNTASDGFDLVMGTSSDAYIFNRENGPMLFGTNSTERARITSGGYFKASNNGTYADSTGGYHEFYQTNNTDTVRVTSTSTAVSGAYGVYVDLTTDPNATDSFFLRCYGGANQRASIRSNGGLANYQSNNVDLSDIRTKTDISPLASYWNKIAALEIVTYKYKDQTHDDLNIGVIAQQVEQVAPEFVDPDGFGETPEDGVPLKTIYNKDLTFAAIKALQEAMARIEKLEAEVAALKGA